MNNEINEENKILHQWRQEVFKNCLTTSSVKCNNLKEIITQVVDDFSFPDGCLDLGKEEQEKFIDALEQRIKGGTFR